MFLLKFLLCFVKSLVSTLSNVLTGILNLHIIYKFIGIFATKKFKPAGKKHKYAILIPTRNESAVIADLLESIKLQNYEQDLITTFVIADNCTDNTAQTAIDHGAVCYSRHDPNEHTKGYALKYLIECISKDYGIDAFEGYFIFDADNLLKEDYISRMNDAFDAGEKIVTSYRASKNFDSNWISASYFLHWLRTVRYEHRARSLLGLATRVQGTGYLISSELLRKG